jgi:hypothetical protein
MPRPGDILASAVVLLAGLAGAPASAAIWNVHADGSGDTPTIQAAIDTAAAGDEIRIHPGTYYEQPFVQKALTFVGVGGAGVTTIDGGDYGTVFTVFLEEGDIVVEGLHIVGAGTDPSSRPRKALSLNMGHGFTVRDCDLESFSAHGHGTIVDCRILRGSNTATGNAVLERCVFEDVEGGWGAAAVSVRDDAIVRNCTFRRCNGGAEWPIVGYETFPTGSPLIEGNLFEDCMSPCVGPSLWPPVGPQPARASVDFVTVRGNTFVGNERGPLGPFVADRGSFWFQPGLFEANVVTGGELGVWMPPAEWSLSCNNSWGNGTNWVDFPDPTGANGNFSAPPLFCNPAGGDFTVSANSPLLPENNGCGTLIGAFGQGCGTVSVEPVSWGQLKSKYRN